MCVDQKNVFRKFILVQILVVWGGTTKKAGENPWHKRRVNFENFKLSGCYRAFGPGDALEHATGEALKHSLRGAYSL